MQLGVYWILRFLFFIFIDLTKQPYDVASSKYGEMRYTIWSDERWLIEEEKGAFHP